MKMVKINDFWVKVLQAECPACNTPVEITRDARKSNHGFGRKKKCPKCKYYVDIVNFY